jgi:hypothetical protein
VWYIQTTLDLPNATPQNDSRTNQNLKVLTGKCKLLSRSIMIRINLVILANIQLKILYRFFPHLKTRRLEHTQLQFYALVYMNEKLSVNLREKRRTSMCEGTVLGKY